jgi:hypothetical protein
VRANRTNKLTTQNHNSNHVAGSPAHAELDRSVPPQRDHSHTETRQKDTHCNIRNILGVCLTTLEFIVAIVTRDKSGETDKHFAQRWVNIKVELAFDVVGAKFSKVSLVPDDIVGMAYAVEPSPTGEKGVDGGCDMLSTLFEEFTLDVYC